MARVYNFSAGPASLPTAVLEIAQNEMLDYRGTGMSVMEMSHRSDVYQEIFNNAKNNLRLLMQVPTEYEILFLQGGASMQFAMTALNLIGTTGKADYIDTGLWSKKAIEEARRYGNIRVVASSADKSYAYIPSLDQLTFSPDAAYVHITTNNTIYGTTYSTLPDTGSIPLVADMSSNILAQQYDITQFGLIYAGAQKNMGPSGLTVVIIRKDLLGHALDFTPFMMNYEFHAKADSMYNTPPTYAIYIAGLIYNWMLERGGVVAIEQINRTKATHLYHFLDQSSLFRSTVEGTDRSIMNIPFVTGNPAMDDKFITAATAAGFVNLKGHRSVGGMRASLYNAISLQAVEALVEFMETFEKENLQHV